MILDTFAVAQLSNSPIYTPVDSVQGMKIRWLVVSALSP